MNQSRSFLTVLLLSCSMYLAAAAGLKPTELKCERTVAPLGIDVEQPVLSWKLAAQVRQRSKMQRAYQVLAATDPRLLSEKRVDLWNSGKVLSDETLNVRYAGAALASHQKVFWKVRVWDEADSASEWSEPSAWTMGILSRADWQSAGWITDAELLPEAPGLNGRRNSTILLRREFDARPGLRRALLHISGLGHYQAALNGKPIAPDSLLLPAWSDYRHSCFYDSHEVTGAIRSGGNAIGVVLAGGMYHVAPGRYVKFTTPHKPLVAIAQLRLEYENGEVDTIVTDSGWSVSQGPTTFCNVFGGEDYDARLEPNGWTTAGFDSSTWRSAVTVQGPGGTLRGSAEMSPPFKRHGILRPISITPIEPGVSVYDLGQNVALMIRLKVRGPAGSAVKIIPAELLGANGRVDRGSCGGGEASWNYTLAGTGKEDWEPKFFYHGSRFLEVRSTPAVAGGSLPEIIELEGVIVHSDSPPAGEFAAADPLLNRIRTLIRWAQRSNLAHVISDCPHRERLGWLEQYHLHGPSLRYEWNLDRLYPKTLRDMADSQLENGLVPDIAPEYVVFDGGFRDSPEWGSAIALVPWQQYLWTGDTEPLRRYFDRIERYVTYLRSKSTDHIVSHGLGDWYDLGPNAPGVAQLTPIPVTATAFYYENTKILAEASRLLKRPDDARKYEELAAAIKRSFNSRFFNRETGAYATGSQTAQALPLVMGLVEEQERPRVVAALKADLKKSGITAGDVGHRYVLRALADAGDSELVYTMHSQTQKPGYGYILKKGATALTEAWDAGRGSSHNHFMLGHITEWFYHDLAGIQPDPQKPGFKRFVIRPSPVTGVEFARASYESSRGLISSAWQQESDQFRLNVQIPPNTSALVYLPAQTGAVIREGGRDLHRSKGIKQVSRAGGIAVLEVGSGAYEFTSKPDSQAVYGQK